MKKLLSLTLALMLLATCVTGCGKKEDPALADTANQDAAASESPAV